MKIRRYLHSLLLMALLPPAALAAAAQSKAPPARPNLLLITVDDMQFDSAGAFGSRVPGVTPHIDRLAAEGMRMLRGHVTVPVCMPGRAVWMTGRYSHNNGALGFEEIREGVPALPEVLKKAGYRTGLMGKVGHVVPSRHAAFDLVVSEREALQGRDPAAYGRAALEFFRSARAAGQPFFFMANAHDPHRPFAGSDQEKTARRRPAAPAPVTRTFSPEEVTTPGFLPDLPPVRREVAEYTTSVHRADQTTGALLRALDEAGCREGTLVMFLSDHGMSFPFSKTNCYRFGTQTPWIVRWPGRIRPGSSDDRHFVGGIDLAPTLLDAAGLPPLEGCDGRSFLPVLQGKRQPGREEIYTQFHATSGRRKYYMRALHDERWSYHYNPWSDGRTVFRNEGQNGRTWRAMVEAAQTDPAAAERVRYYELRAVEELYDFRNDPYSLKNLADDPAFSRRRDVMRRRMREKMAACRDPLLTEFEARIRPGNQKQ